MNPVTAWRLRRRANLLAGVLLIAVSLTLAAVASGEGSGTIYRGDDPSRFRSHLEWRTGNYGGSDSPEFILRRRTLLKLYAREGEFILLGSSGIGVGGALDNGDIRVLTPGEVSGTIGQENIPALSGGSVQGVFANGFSCAAQRAAANDGRGRIGTRAEELAGPLPNTGGYAPCVYRAPQTGIYTVIFTGPSGANSNDEPQVSGRLAPVAADFGPLQLTSVTAWDVTVRDVSGADRPGRLFTYYYAGNTGGGARPIRGESFVVTTSGFRYRLVMNGDPFGFLLYANQLGFQNSDGTPLYRNLLADLAAGTQEQNELRELQGGVRLLPPTYPIFAGAPDPLTLDALGIPRVATAPGIDRFVFRGAGLGNTTGVAQGGTFSFTTSQPGAFYVVVSRDGVDFDPTNPRNKALRGVAETAGPVTVVWDGRDNEGQPFPAGDYTAATAVQGGEVHFPFLDVENNVDGGPVVELVNPPDVTGDGTGDCPPLNGGCFGAFYDDRGYRAASGTLVGVAVNGNLCPGDANNPRGFGQPPLIGASDPLRGYDTRTNQRAFGFPFEANPAAICLPNGGFGDKKALDVWTYYPSAVLRTPLRVLSPTAITLRSLSAVREGNGVVVRWETDLELGTFGFHVLRSATGRLEDATRVTRTLILARGTVVRGAVYSWADTTAGDVSVQYSYWIEEIETMGGTRRYGPVQPTTTPALGTYQVVLPLLMR